MMSSNDPMFSPRDPFNPYGSAPARTKSSSWLWAIVALAGLGIVGIVVCCGGGFWLMSFGLNVMTAEVEDDLRDNPRFQEHVGEIQQFEMDWSRSFGENDNDTFVYNVKGTKGSGKITIKHITNDAGEEEIVSASLRLDSGQTVELIP